MVRQTRRVFAQERAERIISKPKPTMHPFYPTEEKLLKQLKAEHPELDEKIREHPPALDERVGTLRITSQEIAQLERGVSQPTRPRIEDGQQKDVRLLPQARITEQEPELGFYEPPEDKVAPGRVLFSKAMKLLEIRENDEEKALELAKQCGVDQSNMQYIFRYFAPFTQHMDIPELGKPKVEELDDDSPQEISGHRFMLRKQRLVSDLEQQRVNARMVTKGDKTLQETDKDTEKNDQRT